MTPTSRGRATWCASARAAALLVAWLLVACQVPGALRERVFSTYTEIDPLDPEAPLDVGPDPPTPEEPEEPDQDARGESFVAPIPSHSPSLGWGVMLTAGYIFRIDRDDYETPPSTVAAGGFYTDNNSRAALLAFKGHVARDRWRPTAGVVKARIYYDFFGVGADAGQEGRSVELQADAESIRLGLLRRLELPALGRLSEGLYIGPTLALAQVENSLRSNLDLGRLGSDLGLSSRLLDESGLPSGLDLDADTDIPRLGLHLQRDTRDNQFYPLRGSLFDFKADFINESWGADFSYEIYDLNFRSYGPLGDENVLAWRIAGRFTDGDIPFFALSSHDLRGYERGRYRDRIALAAEIELRRTLWKRIGAVAFLGVGEVLPRLSELNASDALINGGFGLRYRLTEKNPLNYRIDFAWSEDDFEVYFSIGEAF